jgi:integrase
MATIRKRKWATRAGVERSAWVATYGDQEGKRRLKTFATKKAADAWLVTARGQVATGVHTPESTSATVAEAAALWLQRCEGERVERSTLVQYQAHARLHIVPLIGNMKLARLTVPVVEAFKDELLRTRSRAMARKVLASLKGVLKDALRRGLVAQNVALSVTVSKASRDKDHIEAGTAYPTKAEVGRLLDAAPPRWRPFLVTAVFTGLRASELRGLTWANVDLDARMIRVRQRADRWRDIGRPKSKGSRRDVPMTPMVYNSLREWRLACPKGELDLVFPSADGRVADHANIIRALAPTFAAAGVRPYGLHGFRHFFASWLVDQGFSMKRVQALMGHSTITMTSDVYSHLWPKEDDHAKFAAGELAVVKVTG